MEEKDEKKKEHHLQHEAMHLPKAKPNTKLWIMAIALGLLIVLAGVQAVELVGLKNQLNRGLLGLAASGGSNPTISTGKSSGDLTKNLQNLPAMVGGC